MLVKRAEGDGVWSAFETSLDDGTHSLRDVLQQEAGMVRGSFEEVSAFLRREIHVDPTFAGFVALCRKRGASVTIVSSGVEQIIADRLAEAGVCDLPIVASGLVVEPEGWRLIFRDDVPNGTDKARLVREARAAGARTVFIGDGRSDYDAAVAAEIRFVKRGRPLERYLATQGVPFERFTTFAELTEKLPSLA